jgi:ubiquinone/menaquinone biosynthesis C-methylase UbiE
MEAIAASLGCSNPTALARLHPGEIVLDLGSGGGIDALLSARRVGPTGKAYGLDVTDEIEQIPLPDNSVDVIISNCVIYLSSDNDRVLAEAFRSLRTGGRFAVSDIVVRGEVPEQILRNIELWVGCIAGVLADQEYRTKLARAGFTSIDIESTRICRVEDTREYLSDKGIDLEAIAAKIDSKFGSAFIRAQKPATS